MEAAYIDLGNPGGDFQTSGSDGTYRLGVSGLSASVLGIVPIGPIEVFGKIGRYFYDVDTSISFDDDSPDFSASNSRNDMMWGAGVSTVFFDRLEVRAEYERIKLEDFDDSDALWLSAAWRF